MVGYRTEEGRIGVTIGDYEESLAPAYISEESFPTNDYEALEDSVYSEDPMYLDGRHPPDEYHPPDDGWHSGEQRLAFRSDRGLFVVDMIRPDIENDIEEMTASLREILGEL